MVLALFQLSVLCKREQVWGAAGEKRAEKKMDTGSAGGQKHEVLWAEVNPVCTVPRHVGFPSPSSALFLF